MSEYIDREAAYQTLTEYYHHTTEGMHSALREAISRVPAADVAPVVRGEWIWTVSDDEYLGAYWKCNRCDEYSYIHYNFCPKCGADMREES